MEILGKGILLPAVTFFMKCRHGEKLLIRVMSKKHIKKVNKDWRVAYSLVFKILNLIKVYNNILYKFLLN